MNRDRWSCEEDLCVVFAVLNCRGDIVVGTDITKATLWKKIIQIYNDEIGKRPNIIQKRTEKSIRGRWGLINGDVVKRISQLGEAERMQASGTNVDDVEQTTLLLFKQAHGKKFIFQHCVADLTEYCTRWRPGQDSTDLTIDSSKRSSDEVGLPRPDKVKKVKA